MIPAKGLCRGCCQPVPPPKRTWCSAFCKERYGPHIVRRRVWERDKGVCQICRLDIMAENIQRHVDKYGVRCGSITAMKMKGGTRWECDHITPFAQGGLTIMENLRVLCKGCHRGRHANKVKNEPKYQLHTGAV